MIVALALLPVPAHAQVTSYYSWGEGGPHPPTILGLYGNLCCESNVTGPQLGSQGSTLPDYECPGAYHGERYLHVAEDPHSSTPQAYVARVTGLNDGDVVTAGFCAYDVTPGAAPSQRIWGGYSPSDDINGYLGSAGGNPEYTTGIGWEYIEHTWTFIGGDSNALVVQCRLYSTPMTSNPDHTDFWVDYIWVTAPEHSDVMFPGPGIPVSTPVESASWSRIKAFYR